MRLKCVYTCTNSQAYVLELCVYMYKSQAYVLEWCVYMYIHVDLPTHVYVCLNCVYTCIYLYKLTALCG